LRYKHFRFRNFKGIEDMTLELSGDVTTLIGLNESGKTTILEAMFCFSYGAEDLDVINPEMASLRVPDRWVPIARRANFNDTVLIQAVVALSSEDKKAYRRHMLQNFGLALANIPDQITISEHYQFENSRYEKTQRRWVLDLSGTTGRQRTPRPYGDSTEEWKGAVEYLKQALPRIWYFPNFLFELPERFSLQEAGSGIGDEERDKSRFYRSTFEQILAQQDYGANLETHVVQRLGSTDRADQRGLQAVLLDMGRAITTTIFDGWNRIFGREPIAQEVELAAEHDATEGPFLELKIKGPDGYYDLSERSLGFRWFFMFLLMTSFHGLEEDGPGSLFLLDEPASNLHSSAQAELLTSFETLAQKCHLVYTTHSQHLINVRWLDSAYVVQNAALGSLDFADYVTRRVGANTNVSATRYRRFVSEHPDQTSYFQPVLDLLEYKPSLLEPVPDVVLVEGKSDFYLLRYVIDVLGSDSDLRLVPGTGAGSLDPVIRLHIGWGKSFVVLLDGDAEGIKQRDRYEQLFGPILRDRCVMLPEAVGESVVLEAEDMLSDVDRERLIDAVLPAGPGRPAPKKALAQAVMELYARAEAVDLESATAARFEALLSDLKQRLSAQS
jgi:hypothetical protein